MSWMDGWMVLFSTKEVVVLLSLRLFLFFLCLFLLMMLMEGKSTSSNCSCCCNLLFYLVLVGMLWIFLFLMLLVLDYIIIRKNKKNFSLIIIKDVNKLKTKSVPYNRCYIYLYILLPRHKHQLRQHPSRQAARDACGASLPSCSQPQTRWR